MAIDSDTQGADARLAVQFYKKSLKQDIASDEAGRPIFKEFDFVRIMTVSYTHLTLPTKRIV